MRGGFRVSEMTPARRLAGASIEATRMRRADRVAAVLEPHAPLLQRKPEWRKLRILELFQGKI
jgi:hypothetical protein